MSEVKNIARDVQAALPNSDQTQIFHAEGSSVIITDHEIFEVYEDGENVFVQVAKREAFEAVGDDTMWWATIDGESNPHFTDEALEPYRYGDESTYQPFEGQNLSRMAEEFNALDDAGYADLVNGRITLGGQKKSFIEIAEEQGWSQDSLIAVLTGFVDENGNKDVLAQYAQAVADRENESVSES